MGRRRGQGAARDGGRGACGGGRGEELWRGARMRRRGCGVGRWGLGRGSVLGGWREAIDAAAYLSWPRRTRYPRRRRCALRVWAGGCGRAGAGATAHVSRATAAAGTCGVGRAGGPVRGMGSPELGLGMGRGLVRTERPAGREAGRLGGWEAGSRGRGMGGEWLRALQLWGPVGCGKVAASCSMRVGDGPGVRRQRRGGRGVGSRFWRSAHSIVADHMPGAPALGTRGL